MPLSFAVLGLLVEQGDGADELTQRARDRIVGWEPARASVVEALTALRQQGLVRVRGVAAGAGGRTRDRYEATVEGARAFNAWMCDSPRRLLSIEELKVRLALTQPYHRIHLHAALQEQWRLCIDQMGRSLHLPWAAEPPTRASRHLGFGHLLTRVEMIHLHAMMVTIEDCLAELEASPARSLRDVRGTPRA